jgi:hypothetical protein
MTEPDTSGQYPDPEARVREVLRKNIGTLEQTRRRCQEWGKSHREIDTAIAESCAALGQPAPLCTKPEGQYPDPEAIRQKRIAELELAIDQGESSGAEHDEEGRARLAELRAELSRLRNEQPKGGDDRLITITVGIGRNGDIYEDTQTHGNSWADVYRGMHAVKAEIERLIEQRRECPNNPKCESYVIEPSPSPEPQDVREALLAAQRTLAAYQKQGAPHTFVGDISLQKVHTLIDAAIAQSDAQPVGWRKALEQMWFKDSWFELEGGARLNFEGKTLTQIWQRLLEGFFQSDYYRSLYAAPPRPDASGLIEALQQIQKKADEFDRAGTTHALELLSTTDELCRGPFGQIETIANEALRSIPEDAMTRERALIPGLTLVRKPLETYLIVREEDGDRELTATECEKLYALASAQQEPAPSADAEGVAKELAAKLFIEATVDDAAFDCDLATPIIASALRRCAGVGGVIGEIAAERKRQVASEGWSTEHDDDHDRDEMARAAACYALPERYRKMTVRDDDGDSTPTEVPELWPWSVVWWKPKSPRRDLLRAGALIIAEIERLDRATARAKSGEKGGAR